MRYNLFYFNEGEKIYLEKNLTADEVYRWFESSCTHWSSKGNANGVTVYYESFIGRR